MSAIYCMLGIAVVAALCIGTVLALDFRRHARLVRMKREADAAANFLGVTISARAGTEKENTAAQVEACGASTDKHTGAVPAAGEETAGSGVTVMDKMDAEPRRCVRCHHFHLDVDSLICGGCREVMSHLKQTNGGAA